MFLVVVISCLPGISSFSNFHYHHSFSSSVNPITPIRHFTPCVDDAILSSPSFVSSKNAAEYSTKLRIPKNAWIARLNAKDTPFGSQFCLLGRRTNDDDYDDYDEDKFEYARVRRGRRRGGGDRYIDEDEFDIDDDDYDSDYDRRTSGRRVDYYEDEDDDENDEYFDDDDEEDDEFDIDEIVDTMDFAVTIPNPILDNLDPDRATERVGEIFSDRVFLRDISIVGVLVWLWSQSAPTSIFEYFK